MARKYDDASTVDEVLRDIGYQPGTSLEGFLAV